MTKYDFPVVTRHLDSDDLFELVQSLNPTLMENVKFREAQPAFLAPLDSSVLASLISGGAAVVVALINGLFLLWIQKHSKSQAKESTKHEKPVLIVRTDRMTINIRTQEDLPDEDEIDRDRVLEIRLDVQEQ